MVEAVRLTQQILLGNISPDFGAMETRRGKKVTPCKSVTKDSGRTPEKKEALEFMNPKEDITRKLFEEELCASNSKLGNRQTMVPGLNPEHRPAEGA
jgi:hypothetical protein